MDAYVFGFYNCPLRSDGMVGVHVSGIIIFSGSHFIAILLLFHRLCVCVRERKKFCMELNSNVEIEYNLSVLFFCFPLTVYSSELEVCNSPGVQYLYGYQPYDRC